MDGPQDNCKGQAGDGWGITADDDALERFLQEDALLDAIRGAPNPSDPSAGGPGAAQALEGAVAPARDDEFDKLCEMLASDGPKERRTDVAVVSEPVPKVIGAPDLEDPDGKVHRVPVAKELPRKRPVLPWQGALLGLVTLLALAWWGPGAFSTEVVDDAARWRRHEVGHAPRIKVPAAMSAADNDTLPAVEVQHLGSIGVRWSSDMAASANTTSVTGNATQSLEDPAGSVDPEAEASRADRGRSRGKRKGGASALY